jgi:porin
VQQPIATATGEAENTLVAAVTSPRQAGSPDFEREKQRSDAQPARFEAAYKASVWSGLSGPLRGHTDYLGNLDLKLTLAGERLYGLRDNTLFVHLLHDHGSKPNRRVGAAQGLDNIEVDTNTGKLYQLWMQQQFADDRVSVLAGLYDLNSEFYVTDASALFVHPALGIGTDMAQSGRNGPSIFPTTSAALRLRVEPFASTYLQAAILDGVPGDPDDPRGTHVRFNHGDGALWVTEAGLRTGEADSRGKVALGYWRYTARFDHLVDIDADGAPLRDVSRGAYLLAEQPLWQADGRGAITGFARFGVASASVNEFRSALAIGAVWQGPLRGRDEDSLGLVFAGARRGEAFRRAAILADEPVAHNERAWELTYRARATDWLWLQPGLQHVLTRVPGAARSTLAFARAELNF